MFKKIERYAMVSASTPAIDIDRPKLPSVIIYQFCEKSRGWPKVVAVSRFTIVAYLDLSSGLLGDVADCCGFGGISRIRRISRFLRIMCDSDDKKDAV